MKKPLAIIRKKFHTEGLPVDREVYLGRALEEMRQGKIFQYGNFIACVSPQGMVHIYRDGGDVSLLVAGRRLMRDVWRETTFQVLRAPIRQPRVKRFAEILGWRCVRHLPFGVDIYEVHR